MTFEPEMTEPAELDCGAEELEPAAELDREAEDSAGAFEDEDACVTDDDDAAEQPSVQQKTPSL